MRILFIVFSIILSNFLFSNAQTSTIIVHSYNIKVVLSESTQTIEVELICNIEKKDDSDVMEFLFNSGSNLYSVSYREDNHWHNITFNFNGKDSLHLITGERFVRGNNYDLKFEYSFPVEELNDTLLILDRGHRWYPLIINQVFTYTLNCNVPEKYKVLSSGKLQEVNNVNGSSIFTWDCNKPVFKLPLIIFDPKNYKRTEIISSENYIEFYSLTIDSIETKNILNQANTILGYFNKTIGGFSRDKLIYFEVPDFQGVNVGSGLLTTGTESLELIGKGYRDALILTLAQQWFGAGVFADFNKKEFFFFSISLPHYLRLMYMRDSAGEEAFNNSLLEPMKRYEEFAGSENDMAVIYVDMPNTKEKAIVLYAKGSFILSKIENEMGRDNWRTFLADLYLAFCGKIMTYDDFKINMAKYDKTGSALILFEKLMNEKEMPE
jgi:hypothetical protein